MHRTPVTARHASVGGDRSVGRARNVWVLMFRVLVLLGVVLVVAGTAQAAGSASDPSAATFGCDEELGPMVIANIDCTLGVADAFARVAPIAVTGESLDRLGLDRAPWCDEFADLRIYGCASAVPGIRDNGFVSCTESPQPHLRLAATNGAANLGCHVAPWLQRVFHELAENKVTTDACRALTNPGPACIP